MAMVRHEDDELRTWVNGLHISVGLLCVGVLAATSLAEERARGSVDLLLTTPLENWRIVLGKWLGAFRLVPPLAILPVFVAFGAGKPGGERELAALLMAAFVLASGAAVTSLGLAMATWCSRLGRAVALTVSLYLLVTVGWIFAVVASYADPDRLLMGSPFGWPAVVTERLGRGTFGGFWGSAVEWILLDAWTAAALLGATVKTFGRCLGRVDGRSRPRGRGELNQMQASASGDTRRVGITAP